MSAIAKRLNEIAVHQMRVLSEMDNRHLRKGSYL